MRHAEAGFSLVEMLVALAVFSLAVLALLNLSGQNARTALVVEEQVLAGVVADNVAAESLLAPAGALAGPGEGREHAGGRDWQWRRRPVPTAVAGLVRIDVDVSVAGEARVVASRSVFRSEP